MPNIAMVLKEEIARIARHEVKTAVTKVHKPTVTLRKDAAALKRKIALLEKAVKELRTMTAKAPEAPAAEPAGKAWISGTGVKSLRKKLGLSQAQLAKLTGVSDQAVVMWEKKPGMLKLRPTTLVALLPLRGIGVTEARKRLEAIEVKQVAKAKKAVAKKAVKGKRGKRRGK